MKINDMLYKAIRIHAEKLKNIVLKHDDVINNCVSTSSDLPLSALQGKLLYDQINQISYPHFRKFYLEKGEHLFSIDNSSYIMMFGCMANPTPTSIYGDILNNPVPEAQYSYMLIFSKNSNGSLVVRPQAIQDFNNRKEYINIANQNNKLKMTVGHDNGANILFFAVYGDINLDE